MAGGSGPECCLLQGETGDGRWQPMAWDLRQARAPRALAVSCSCQLLLHQHQLGTICRASLQRQVWLVLTCYRLSYWVICILFINHLKQVSFLWWHCEVHSNTQGLEQMIQGQLKIVSTLVPHCVFRGNTVLLVPGPQHRLHTPVGCWLLEDLTGGMLQLAAYCILSPSFHQGKNMLSDADLHPTRLSKYGCWTNLYSRWWILPNRAKPQTPRHSEFVNSQPSRNPWWSLEKQFPLMCWETAAAPVLYHKPCMSEHVPVSLPHKPIMYRSALEPVPQQV